MLSPHRTDAAAFEFTLSGPPGLYAVLSSANLAAWNDLGAVTNNLCRAVFFDIEAGLSPQSSLRPMESTCAKSFREIDTCTAIAFTACFLLVILSVESKASASVEIKL